MTYSIKEVSKIVDLPPHTLRYYEDCGFLSDVKRDASGHRIYSQRGLEEINLAKCLRACNLSIDQMKHFFAFYYAAVPTKERQELLKEVRQYLKNKQTEFCRAIQLLKV